MPSTAKPLWLLTWLAIMVGPVTDFLFWTAVLKSGALPHDGDAIAIPIFQGIIGTVALAPLALTITWFCLRRYNAQTSIFAWRKERPVVSIVATMVFGGLTCLLAYDVGRVFMGYYSPPEFISIPAALIRMAGLMAMRAALIDQLNAEPKLQAA
ncbi:hypothetical protein [Methylobacterium sp. D48H]